LKYIPVIVAAALGWVFCATAHSYEYEKNDVKVSLSGYLDARAVAAFDRDTPKEYPTTELGIDCKTTISSWGAAKLYLQLIDDGTVTDPENGLLFNQLDKVYQDKNPYVDVDEAYVDFFSEKADVRIGIQKFSWGRLDEINPTDSINPEDYSQGTINEELERKIGIPAVKVSSYSDLANVELAWIPRYVPYRLPKPEEKWYPGPLKAPEYVQTDGTVGSIPVTSKHEDISLPDGGIENSEGAVRVSKLVGGWDLSVSYYRGYDVMPITDVYSDLTIEIVDMFALDYTLALDLTYKPALHKMNVWGFDFMTTLGSFTVRGECAYFDEKYYNRRLESVLGQELSRSKQEEIFNEFYQNYLDSGGTLTTQTFRINPRINIPMKAMKYGVGVDYIYGDLSVSMQVIQEFVPDYDDSMPVYFINEDGYNTLVTAMLRQMFLQNTLELTLRGAYGIEFKDYVFRPSLKYSFTNTLQGTVGIVILGGKYDNSMFGQYDRNDEAYAQLRCSF
jgi:hypothetical protein